MLQPTNLPTTYKQLTENLLTTYMYQQLTNTKRLVHSYDASISISARKSMCELGQCKHKCNHMHAWVHMCVCLCLCLHLCLCLCLCRMCEPALTDNLHERTTCQHLTDNPLATYQQPSNLQCTNNLHVPTT